MTQPALFDASPWEVEPPASADPGLTADQRRTARQREAIAAGRHPLMGGPLHPDAPAEPAPYRTRGLPFTCGSCRFREVLPYRGRAYPKCLVELGDRPETRDLNDLDHVSHGPGTDVRAWWPACPRWEQRAEEDTHNERRDDP